MLQQFQQAAQAAGAGGAGGPMPDMGGAAPAPDDAPAEPKQAKGKVVDAEVVDVEEEDK